MYNETLKYSSKLIFLKVNNFIKPRIFDEWEILKSY